MAKFTFRTPGPNASNWRKVKSREPEETLVNRDVYEDQQLDRSKIEKVRSRGPRTALSVIVGLLVATVVWVMLSFLAMAFVSVSGAFSGMGSGMGGPTYYQAETKEINGLTGMKECYRPIDENGDALAGAKCYDDYSDVPEPQWYKEKMANAGAGSSSGMDLMSALTSSDPYGMWKWYISLGAGLVVALILHSWLMRDLEAQNAMNNTKDINQYTNDQRIALPEEVMAKFEWIPDAGAHFSASPNSMISHVMIDKKGLKKIKVAKRAEKDIIDEDGDIVYLKGEIMVDDNGDTIFTTEEAVDREFGEALYDASNAPKSVRRYYDTNKIDYNKGNRDRDKLEGYDTVADLINGDWEFPEYEVQRPAGAYLMDTAPVNTMVLAMTRAGKGQTYIEPMIDAWMREKEPQNILINDPKGELLVKNYVPATVRGFQVVQFNLINSMKTDIYNPLGMAAEAAREGDSTKCALYVENIADVFFPTDGGEDPVWPNAANNAFKRAAYGLIEFYLEEERELRETAARTNMDPAVLENKLDQMWGKVTLYNCYQLFVQLTAKKRKNPVAEVSAKMKALAAKGDSEGTYEADKAVLDAEMEAAKKKEFMWEDKPELDLLTLYFNATSALPRNSMRNLIANADNALRSMGAAEKMLASVYGIAITAMSFFTDPTISTLTSGTPSQNTDLGGLSFPRRFGVRFGMNMLKRYHLVGIQVRWQGYADATFTESLGKDFYHEDTISREGWARGYFKGKFPNKEAWLKLELVNPQTHMLVRTFYFHFVKSYQVTLNGRQMVTDPVTDQKIVKNGIITEVILEKDENGNVIGSKPGNTTYPQVKLVNVSSGSPRKVDSRANAIIQTNVRYSESAKMVFLVTPPHLMKYAKLVLIMLKQLVDLNFDKSYMTKSNQKPQYATRFMLDELGNLQSEGHGIGGFETMLSIGLGQSQQFTLILQTLQQLKAVYGDDVDKIVQGNVSNIIYLKSTDDSMIETLVKMSGTTHRVYRDSKTVTRDVMEIMGKNEGKISYTMTNKEIPVISYNDLAYLSERNSIVFRAGDAPVWNRNQTILPMSWRLFKDKITHPGHDYTLQTIPTLSSALDFDVRQNQPDFDKMLAKRMAQAERSEQAKKIYANAYGLSDYEVSRLDPDVYSDEVMSLVTTITWENMGRNPEEIDDVVDVEELDDPMLFSDDHHFELLENTEVTRATAEAQKKEDARSTKRFAGNMISPADLTGKDGAPNHQLDSVIIEAFKEARAHMEKDMDNFSVIGDALCSTRREPFISWSSTEVASLTAATMNEAVQQKNTRAFAEEDVDSSDVSNLSFVVHDAFITFLASLPDWNKLGKGKFESAMRKRMSA